MKRTNTRAPRTALVRNRRALCVRFFVLALCLLITGAAVALP